MCLLSFSLARELLFVLSLFIYRFMQVRDRGPTCRSQAIRLNNFHVVYLGMLGDWLALG